MDITIETGDLLGALNKVRGAVQARNTIPILCCVLLTAVNGALKVKATDLDIEVTTSVSVSEMRGDGAVAVDAGRLREIATKLPKGSQTIIRLEEKGLVVKCGRSRFVLPTLPESDFPELSMGNAMWTFEMSAAGILQVFERSQFAISTEETRYYLNGVYFHVVKGKDGPLLRGVATDGHRLAQSDLLCPDGAAEMRGVIVPRKAVGMALSLADKQDEIVVSLDTGKIRFAAGETVMVSKLIDGTFPDYGRVVPLGNDKIFKADRRELATAADRVSTVSSERGRAVKMSLSAGKIILSVTNPDSGSAVEEIEVEYDGEPIDIGFNSRYLADILGGLDTEKVEMKLADPGSPSLICGVGDADFLSVLMPMRV